MNELSLFSGIGGGLLGSHLLGWRTVGYVEIEDYCQQVLAARIRDGIFPKAPIFGDIKTFISEGYARTYKGMVDILTAGFPCQPFSYAGLRKAQEDKRNRWPQTAETIRLVRPRLCLLENVPALLDTDYFGQILQDLAEIGYVGQWECVPASCFGTYHKRERLWIMAHPYQQHEEFCDMVERRSARRASLLSTQLHSDALAKRGQKAGERLASEPELDRMVHGTPNWMDRLEAIGNIQVPAVVEYMGKILQG